MRFLSRLSQLSLVFCFFSALHAQQQDQKYWVVARGGLNLRAEPSLTGKKVVTIPEGEQVAYLESAGSVTVGKVSGEWWQITWQDKTGFAFSGFLSPTKLLAIDTNKPAQGQFHEACLAMAADRAPESCGAECGKSYFILESKGDFYLKYGGGPGCFGASFPHVGRWRTDRDSIVLEIDEIRKCYHNCEQYCSEGILTDEPIENCAQFCPVKGKVPDACPKKMTREQFQAKFSKTH